MKKLVLALTAALTAYWGAAAPLALDLNTATGGERGQVNGKNTVFLPKTAEVKKDAVTLVLPQPLPAGTWLVDFELYGDWATRNINMLFGFDNQAKFMIDTSLFQRTRDFYHAKVILRTQSPISEIKMYSNRKRDLDGLALAAVTIDACPPELLTSPDSMIYFELPVQDGLIGWPNDMAYGVYVFQFKDVSGLNVETPKGKFEIPPAKSINLAGKEFTKLAIKGDSPAVVAGLRCVDSPVNYPEYKKAAPAVFDLSRRDKGILKLTGTPKGGPEVPLYPDGKSIALVTSWDDGRKFDFQLVDILDKYAIRGTLAVNAFSETMPDLEKFEDRGFEIASHSYSHPALWNCTPEKCRKEYESLRAVLEQKLGHPVISFVFPFNYQPSYNESGDYVLDGMTAAGFWGGRPTSQAGDKTIQNMADKVLLKPDFHFMTSPANVAARLQKAREIPGSFIYLWGHSYELVNGGDKRLEENLAILGNQPDIWYASQGSFSVWQFIRNHLEIKKIADNEYEVAIPWIHDDVKTFAPMTLTVPAGTTGVYWNDRKIDIDDDNQVVLEL